MSSAAHHAPHEAHGHAHHEPQTVFGFWIYLMSDCLIFGSLFAAFAVLSGSTAGGPTAKELFELDFVFVETMLLLLSSFTFGVAMLAMQKKSVSQVMIWLAITWLLGAGFIGMEVYEFNHLIHAGHGPDRSAFLTAFFSLVGTHGLHVTGGLIWILVMMGLIASRGFTDSNVRQLSCLSLFWHFLDIVWICVFSFVYLIGAL